jgi:hypothetical protein
VVSFPCYDFLNNFAQAAPALTGFFAHVQQLDQPSGNKTRKKSYQQNKACRHGHRPKKKSNLHTSGVLKNKKSRQQKQNNKKNNFYTSHDLFLRLQRMQ